MPKVPYAAFLRVYEPLAAFPQAERSHWAHYVRSEDLPGVQEELNRSLAASLRAPGQLVPEHESADAYVATVDGVVYVCPWRTRLRAWRAMEDLGQGAMPEEVLEQVVGADVRRAVREKHEAWRQQHPDARPWIRSSLWHIPLRWFVLFSGDDREYREPTAVGTADLRYRTPMERARTRVNRALRTLRTAVPDGPLTPALEEVARWLEEFHTRSLVELDYGGLVHTISPGELAGDESAEDVHRALQALALGQPERATELHETLTERWMHLRERQFAS